MGIQVQTVDTCTCPWCVTAPTPMVIPDITGAGRGVPAPATLLPPPPLPPTTTYLTAAWHVPPPPAGTDDQAGMPRLPIPPFAEPRPATAPTTRQPQLLPVNVGTPFADAIGFRDPFLE